MFWVELTPQGLGCGFSKTVVFQRYIAPINWVGGWGWVDKQAKRAVVNERGEIVMCIAVPDTCILAESNQLIKYLSPSNSQTEALKQKPNTTGLCHTA